MTSEDQKSLRILALEPYYGGSHRAFLDCLASHSRHEFELLTLPARKWKWRMRGSAIWFAERLRESAVAAIDLILVSDMVSVADLRALLPEALSRCPIVCYFHENQLTYPLSEHDRVDYQFGFTNITSCLAADAVWFNSESHRRAFLDAVGGLLTKMPDHVPTGVVQGIESRSRVRYPLVAPPPGRGSRCPSDDGAPVTILWSHRWEYDKNPRSFFEALFALEREGVDFRLVLLGESFRAAPDVFGEAWSRLARRTVHCGFAESREAYWHLLHGCDVVVSTAIQENFGISVVEAMLCGCEPLLPNRLSYPELLPAVLHGRCLYEGDDDLVDRLREVGRWGTLGVDRSVMVRHLSGLCDPIRCISIYDNDLCRIQRA